MKSRMPLVYMAMLILAGCSHSIPETYSKPQPPPQLGKTPPVIQPLSTSQKQAQAPESLLPVTLTAEAMVTDDPVLEIVKEGDPTVPGPNKPLVYTLTVENVGQPGANLPIMLRCRIPSTSSRSPRAPSATSTAPTASFCRRRSSTRAARSG